jgi:hypothetical protein
MTTSRKKITNAIYARFELNRKIEQIKKEQARKKFIEDTSRKYRLNMLSTSVGLVGE